MEIMILSGIIMGIATLFYLQQIKAKDNKKAQQQGLDYISQIKKIITIVQQHRGLTAAWLNGDTKVTTQLVILKQLISKEMKLLKFTPIYQNERWSAFADHWDRLLKLNKSLLIENSFEQHTLMIKNLAYLLEDTAEISHLTTDFLPEFTNIGYVWRELILTTESIGQSRAIGTGVAVQQYCSSVDKIRLNFLIETMTKITLNTLQHLSYLPQEINTHKELVKRATEKMNQLIETMKFELVNASTITIDNNQYFELATNTMSTMNDIFDHQVMQLKTTL